MEKVILIFDIGKTNKKVLLFNKSLQLVHQHETKFETIVDEDGFECDDIEKIEKWIKDTLNSISKDSNYQIQAVNFSTYGATLMYIDKNGKRLTPAYNYLKPMPKGVLDNFYDTYGGIKEFSRKTASPALDMLNSGLQALWLKRTKPEVFKATEHVLHFPQYLHHFLTGKVFSEYTSIGCHTALWDFDNMTYHQWCKDEGIKLPTPVANETIVRSTIGGIDYNCGIGIHDSSASLAPYIMKSDEKFVLISTGTWCINMNPFNAEPLTMDQLNQDCLSYLSISRNPVKSSRLFMGHIHDVNTERLSHHFNVADDSFKKVTCDEKLLAKLNNTFGSKRIFFANGIPENSIDTEAKLDIFEDFSTAYHKFILDLTAVAYESLNLVLPEENDVKNIYISGGFARNEIYVRQMATLYPDKNIYTSEIDNATAMGAALVVWDAMDEPLPDFDLGLKLWKSFQR